MGYYRTCPYCGAHLDPGERCDCKGGDLLLVDHPSVKAAPVKWNSPTSSKGMDMMCSRGGPGHMGRSRT